MVPTDYFRRDEIEKIIAATFKYEFGGGNDCQFRGLRMRAMSLLMRWGGVDCRSWMQPSWSESTCLRTISEMIRFSSIAPKPACRYRSSYLLMSPISVDILPPDTEGYVRDVAVELVTSGNFQGSIALLDRVGNRVFSQRSRAPFIVGGPRVDRIRVSGHGQVTGLLVWRLDRRVEQLGQPVALLSLLIQGSRPWYDGGLGANQALSEVKHGAPRRLQLPDRPDSPLDPLTAANELARISFFAADISAQCETMVGDLTVAPGQQHRQHHLAATPAARQQFVDISIANTLMAQGMDPGIGR